MASSRSRSSKTFKPQNVIIKIILVAGGTHRDRFKNRLPTGGGCCFEQQLTFTFKRQNVQARVQCIGISALARRDYLALSKVAFMSTAARGPAVAKLPEQIMRNAVTNAVGECCNTLGPGFLQLLNLSACPPRPRQWLLDRRKLALLLQADCLQVTQQRDRAAHQVLQFHDVDVVRIASNRDICRYIAVDIRLPIMQHRWKLATVMLVLETMDPHELDGLPEPIRLTSAPRTFFRHGVNLVRLFAHAAHPVCRIPNAK